MINAYAEGRDLYAVIASMCFNLPYEECLEHYQPGTVIEIDGKQITCGYKTHTYVAGKERRSLAKSVLLGLLYGRGAASVAEQIGKTKKEAQEIFDKFYKAFPRVKAWIDYTYSFVHENGYVEDIVGRKRRLPDIKLNHFDIINNNKTFNPLLGADGTSKSNDKVNYYRLQLAKTTYKTDIEKIIADAANNRIAIYDNSGKIALAERLSVNSRVQGGAATLTKWAMIQIFNNQELKDLGAYLINTVHDEVLVEAPEENADKVAELLTSIMINAAKTFVTNVPMDCDPYIVNCWYEDEYAASIIKEYNELISKKGLNSEQATTSIIENHCEKSKQALLNILSTNN